MNDVLTKRQQSMFVLLTVALSWSCKSAPPPKEADEVDRRKSFVFKHKSIVRDISIMDPRAAEEDGLRPMVLVLHGGLGEDDDTVTLSFGKLDELAAEDDFIVVYPTGIGGHWNDGRNIERYVTQRERVDDVGFLAALIGDLIEKKHIDPQAVFIVGVSDGAMMAHRFACERTQLVHGFAAVIGAMPENVARRRWRCGKTPISVLMINGSEDPIVPVDGGEVEFDGLKLGKVLSVENTFAFWSQHNGCRAVDVSMIPDFSPDDGTRIQRRKATECRQDAKVELFEVQGAGHTWPSGWQYLPEHMIGPVSRDIDAAVAAWRFFQSSL